MTTASTQTLPRLTPLPIWQSSALFLLPGLPTAALLYWGVPLLIERGLSFWWALNLASLPSFLLLLAMVVWLYRAEGRRLDWRSLRERLRLRPMSRLAWWHTTVVFVVMLGAYLGLLFTARAFAQSFGLPVWAAGPGGQPAMAGAFGLLAMRVLVFSLNVVGEELLWRGMLLPRQELHHGRRTWWIHGLQWNAFHWFKPWELLMLLPGNLALAWVCQRHQSTTPGLLVHAAFNGIGVVLMAAAVLGAGP